MAASLVCASFLTAASLEHAQEASLDLCELTLNVFSLSLLKDTFVAGLSTHHLGIVSFHSLEHTFRVLHDLS